MGHPVLRYVFSHFCDWWRHNQ